jgi:hypothetical protein
VGNGILNYLQRLIFRGNDYDRLNPFGQMIDIGIAGYPINIFNVRIYGNYFESFPGKVIKCHSSEFLWIPRNACHGYGAAGKKLVDLLAGSHLNNSFPKVKKS